MKLAERIVMVLLVCILIGGGLYIYRAVQSEKEAVREAVVRGDFEIRDEGALEATITEEGVEEWRRYYPKLVPMRIASSSVFASVANTLPDRIRGLSGTPYLPDGVVKLFAFGTEGEHSIWMKDMNYSIDILWISRSGEIVHIEENVSPDTYPESFASPVPAWYVVEANAGFVENEGINIGDTTVVVVPE